jgi:hypothetical protein
MSAMPSKRDGDASKLTTSGGIRFKVKLLLMSEVSMIPFNSTNLRT